MLRVYIKSKEIVKTQDEKGIHYTDKATGLRLYSDYKGFFFEFSFFLINRSSLLCEIRNDIEITRISCVELVEDLGLKSIGVGRFFCESGTVEIYKNNTKYKISVSSKTVESFNQTVENIFSGKIRPEGSKKTVVENLLEDVKYQKDKNVDLSKIVEGKEMEICRLTEIVEGKEAEICRLTEIVERKEAEVCNLRVALKKACALLPFGSNFLSNLEEQSYLAELDMGWFLKVTKSRFYRFTMWFHKRKKN